VSSSTFVDAYGNHHRSKGLCAGQFTAKPERAPQDPLRDERPLDWVNVAMSDYRFDPRAYLSGLPVQLPQRVTESALELGAGDGWVQHLVIAADGPASEFDVHGSPDGTPVLVTLESGVADLNVRGGRVVVHARSADGNSVTAWGDSEVVVISEDVKLSVSAEDRARVIALGTGRRPRTFAGTYTSPGGTFIEG